MLAVAASAVIAAIVIVVLTGGGTERDGTHRSGAAAPGSVLQLASGYLRLPPSEVRRRLSAGETLGEIANSTHGASRSGLIEALAASGSQAIRQRHLSPGAERAELTALRRALASRVDRARRRAGVMRDAARYLGLSEAQLRARLTGGRTLAQIAAATPGRSRAGLVGGLVAARRSALELALKEKRITPAAERAAAAKLRARAERQIGRAGG
jgi:hypothetical protein